MARTSGIMFGALADGIGRAATSYGQSMQAAAEREDRFRASEQLQRERLDSQRQIAELRAEMRAGGAAGSGGKGASGIIDYAEGSQGEVMLARQAGLTVPQLRALNADARGDSSLLETESTQEAARDGGADDMGPQPGEKVRGVSPATRRWADAKQKTIGEISQMFTQGSAYDDAQKGRATAQGISVRDGIMAGTVAPQQASMAYLATDAKGLFDSSGEVGTYDKSTGAQTLNELGKAKAADERANTANRGREAKTKDFQSLQQERIAIDADLTRLETAIKNERTGLKDLSSKDKPAALERIKAMEAKRTEAEQAKSEIMVRLKEFTTREGGRRVDQPSPRPAAPKPAENAAKPSQADALAQARAAIAAGKSRAAVIQRMKENGYSTEGL